MPVKVFREPGGFWWHQPAEQRRLLKRMSTLRKRSTSGEARGRFSRASSLGAAFASFRKGSSSSDSDSDGDADDDGTEASASSLEGVGALRRVEVDDLRELPARGRGAHGFVEMRL